MSSNKTIIPGMENAYNDSATSFTQSIEGNAGTCVPNILASSKENMSVSNMKPIVGFLYSISKTNIGEFWPLRIGANSIGRSPKCDVCLSEGTVSEDHAVLVVRQMKNPEKIIASVCDSRSTCGTMINGESLGFDQRECFNGDIITIGEHYDLYFMLVDTKQIGLNTCRDFINIEVAKNDFKTSNTNSKNNPYAAPNVNHRTQYMDDLKRSDNEENVEGNRDVMPSNKPGGTIFM